MRNLVLIVPIILFLSCKTQESEKTIITEVPPKASPNASLEPKSLKQEIVLSESGIIWGFDFLSDGNIIFTEKSGKMKVSLNGSLQDLSGLPSTINSEGQGGLLDVCVHPKYKENGWIYFSYSSVENGNGILNLMRAKIQNNELVSKEVLFKTSATNRSKNHYGSRIAFDSKGLLYLAVGEGGSSSQGGRNSPNQNAQNISEGWGKVHRMLDNGTIPTDNPVLVGQTKPSTIFSYGHRNPQGLFIDKSTDQIYVNEHGPKGGDEFNLVQKSKNYGWPWISYGVNYSGQIVSESPTMTGMEDVQYQWTPSIGACGLAKITTDMYGTWKGDFLSGSLALRYMSKLKKNEDGSYSNQKLLNNIGRVRHVKVGADGYIYISVENPGRIIRLVPEF
ncbi:MAG: PQQ-dependent sugar dehydrogenase [Leadbetterella sp.]